jgi:glycosyltransferase involved in cell wall biosynthesis
MRPAALPAGASPLEESPHLRVLVVTDAWTPQLNGVVRTLEMLGQELRALGHDVRYATPQGRFTIPLPTYSEIRLAVFPRRGLEKLFRDFAPDAVHIATEGTMGMSARAICLRHGIAFTTSFHTRFPEYVRARFPIVPQSLVYRWLRWFHAPATAMMVATTSLKRELEGHGFRNLRVWSRGVDVETFRRIPDVSLPYPHPIWINVGRVAVEKNIEAFLALDLPGTKVVIGDGPARTALSHRYPDAKFLGPMTGDALVRAYSSSDVFVFPSRTDTFGLVMLEAMACGLPVAAYPVQGPTDAVGGAPGAILDNDLRAACLQALAIARSPEGANSSPRTFALERTWHKCTRQFLANLAVEPPEEED